MKKSIFFVAGCLMATMVSAQTVFSENFDNVALSENVGELPDGWTTYGDNLTNQSNFVKFGSSWVVSGVETNNQAAASVSMVTTDDNCDRWMVTPAIAVPGGNYQLKFRAFVNLVSASEKLRVALSTTDVAKGSFTTTLRDIVFDGTQGTTAGWNNMEFSLADYAGQTVYIAFVNHGNGQFIFVDDVRVTASTDNFHMVLMESFTSQYCGNCPDGEAELEEAYEGLEDRVAWVSHHSGFQNDAFTVPASTAMEALYNTSSTYAPAVSFDRSMAYTGTLSPGPVHEVESAYNMHQVLSRATSFQDNIVMGFTQINYDASSRQLQTTVEGYFIQNSSIATPHLTIYLVEDSLIAYQSGDQDISNYRHDHVLRACLTDAWGDADPFGATTAGSTFSKSVTYTLPAGLRPQKCYLVAFVSNHGSDVTDRRVHNTTKSGPITSDAGHQLGLESPADAPVCRVAPNPASQRVNVSADATIRAFAVTNSAGQTLMQGRAVNADLLDLDVSRLAPGIYHIHLTTDRGTSTGKMVVVR